MKRRILSLFMTLAICLSLTPITVMADMPEGMVIYVGNVNVTSDGYWTTDGSGNLTASDASNYNVAFDADTNTLTLNNATIAGQYDPTYNNADAGIYAYSRSGSVSLTIQVIGYNEVSGSQGIYALSNGGEVSVTISGGGSLTASGSQNGIRIVSEFSNAALAIEGTAVKASGSYSEGVLVQAGESSTGSLSVDGGSLTASGNTGIEFWFSTGMSGSGTPSLTVAGNAVVDAKSGGIAHNSSNNLSIQGNSGIVFNGSTGTVYGNASLQDDLIIGEGESLILENGANLNANGHNVIVDGGTVDDSIKNSLGDSVKYAPSITTESLPNGTVGTAYRQTLAATGSDIITWSISSGSLPDGLTLNPDTGEITGTPTTANSYSFTVKAKNTYGSKTKELTITINDAKTYSVSVTPAKITLPSVKEGYDPQDPEYITIKNTGNQTIKLEDHGKNPWLIIKLDKNTLKPNEEAKVSIKLKDGLSAETTSTLKGFITYTSEDGTYTDYAHFEATYEIKHDMKHIEAKEATHLEEGNIEYWYCEYCDKYYEGALGTNELSLEDITIPKLTDHTATDTWYHDENSHWHTCECGEVLDKETHEFKWVIDKEATATSEGLKHEECSICGYQKEAIVIPVVGTENQPPVINAKDQTLTVGDKFDPMKGVIATDQEDGDLTDKIVITKNTVDTSKAGKYTVYYEVTDNGGIRVRKTIVVTVKEKSADQTSTTDSKKTNGTNTSANLGIGLFSSLAGASIVGAGLLSVLKKRNGK